MTFETIDWNTDINADPVGKTRFHDTVRNRLAALADQLAIAAVARRISTDMIGPLASGETVLRADGLYVQVEQPKHWPYLGVLVRLESRRPAWWPLEALDAPALMAEQITTFRRTGVPPVWPTMLVAPETAPALAATA